VHLLKPTTVPDRVEEGDSGGKHFELVENADIMIETTHRSDAQRIYHRGFGQDEVAFQLSGRRATQYEEQIVAFGQRSVKRLCA
jgi:hypothetical protein